MDTWSIMLGALLSTPDVVGLVLCLGTGGALAAWVLYAVADRIAEAFKEGVKARSVDCIAGRWGSVDTPFEKRRLSEDEKEQLLRDACLVAIRRPDGEVSAGVLSVTHRLDCGIMAGWLAWVRGKHVTLSRTEAGPEGARVWAAHVHVAESGDGVPGAWVRFEPVTAGSRQQREERA